MTQLRVARKARNILRAMLQAYGTPGMKRYLWNTEFSAGRWNCLDSGVGDCVYPLIEKYAANGRILDLGCGSGSTGNELDSTKYAQYTGVDISDVALEKARQRTQQNGRQERNVYLRGDIFHYVPAQRYHVILFRDSIYYVPPGKIKGMLNRYSDHLTDNGVFVARLASSEKYSAVVSLIEKNFEVLERYVSHLPPALVIVFKPVRRADPP